MAEKQTSISMRIALLKYVHTALSVSNASVEHMRSYLRRNSQDARFLACKSDNTR
jgi:hypothetical protein